MYKFKKCGVNESDIYVTGTHLIMYKEKFIEVKNHPNAQFDSNNQPEYFSCLITSNHNIKIGQEIFWDWEDYIIKLEVF